MWPMICLGIYVWAGFTTAISFCYSSDFCELTRESRDPILDNWFAILLLFILWPLAGLATFVMGPPK
jgi:hypothetical protein